MKFIIKLPFSSKWLDKWGIPYKDITNLIGKPKKLKTKFTKEMADDLKNFEGFNYDKFEN